jgi:hypothetical protein
MTNTNRRGAITIEYLILSIVVLGVGACLLSFQGEIRNAVTAAQSGFESLQENMLEGKTSTTATTTHTHSWKAIIISGERYEMPEEEDLGDDYYHSTFSNDYDSYYDSTTEHKCETCGEIEPHNVTSMTQEELELKLGKENVRLRSGKECSDCDYWEATYWHLSGYKEVSLEDPGDWEEEEEEY